MDTLYDFFLELDKLKNIERQSYVTGLARHENSAEHSWHLALASLTLQKELDLNIDILKTLKMSLIHDICEIGAGDISVYHPDRHKKENEEREYLEQLTSTPLKITHEIKELWEEFEEQKTEESRWVKTIDRLLPFMMNLNTEGKTWINQGIKKSQVIKLNQLTNDQAPEIYEWMLKKIDMAVEKGWLIDE